MNAVIRKPSIAALALTLPMLFFGGLIFLTGHYYLSEWRSETAALVAIGLGLFLAGATTVIAALWVIASFGRSALPLTVAALAIVASGTLLIISVLSPGMPCASPG